MRKFQFILLSVLTGLLLSFGWPAHGFPFLLCIAFVPLLIAEEELNNSNRNYSAAFKFLIYYLAFALWNTFTTWWICNATVFGGIFAIVFNSLFMTIVFILFQLSKKRGGKFIGYLSLIFYWIAFEYLHLNWELSWSWLNLGNGFANYPVFIQWYKYTGTLGGTLWILTVNLIIASGFRFQLTGLRFKVHYSGLKHNLIWQSAIMILPVLFSLWLYFSYKEKGQQINVVIVQPNIDPYNEKFGGIPLEDQISRMLQLALQKTDTTTDLIVFPETAISDGIWENKLNEDGTINRIKSFKKQFPKLNILIGMSSFRFYMKGETKSESARKFSLDDNWYDSYNTALLIDKNDNIEIYHKSKLVPGVERMPYPGVFKFLNKYSIDMGGMTGSLGTQPDRTPLTAILNTSAPSNSQLTTQNSKLRTQNSEPQTQNSEPQTQNSEPKTQNSKPQTQNSEPQTQNSEPQTQNSKPQTQNSKPKTQNSEPQTQNSELLIAPSICYESIYGDFMRKYVKNGANLICIITNDGWWKDTPGYKQHFHYARLRAIETDKYIVRSANTGTSGFINSRGDILSSTQWWKQASVKNLVSINNNNTFYVLYGDYIGIIALIISFIILSYILLIKNYIS